MPITRRLTNPPPVIEECGTCVCRNAINEQQELGDCPRTGRKMHKHEQPCGDWFGLAQLRAPLYGK